MNQQMNQPKSQIKTSVRPDPDPERTHHASKWVFFDRVASAAFTRSRSRATGCFLG